ncbi:flagellar protein FlgN [Virgibacillus sp. C22-A2]|uniref:Flagellar protein FlgN n=1 Tax=Virgibacillus tibetensis TaxID=3042313 RepID=A0ABU6KCR4_9BACI|nr:flagellar protein FlgN [Virgibacillus sp. C22-A2]
MSAQSIIQSLEKLVNLHTNLLEFSQEKTEIMKEGSIEKLQSLLVKERKLIRLTEQAEEKRNKEVINWFAINQLPADDTTVTKMLEFLRDESDKTELEKTTTKLTEVITELKQQEQLNQALINQSMQFVQLSIDMLNPSIHSMNYGSKSDESTEVKRSVFDSKA